MIRGVLIPVSQLITVHSQTPRWAATSCCLRPSSRRRRLRCSPTDWEPGGKDPGFGAFRVIRTNDKKATQPCVCGWRQSRWRDCTCTDIAVARYAARVSGPLLDRIDLNLTVPVVAWRDLVDVRAPGESSDTVRRRVVDARERQRKRLDAIGVRTNAEIPDAALDELVDASGEARALLGRAVEKLRFSARGARRLLRVARTIADLAGERRVEVSELAEALGYRRDEVR